MAEKTNNQKAFVYHHRIKDHLKMKGFAPLKDLDFNGIGETTMGKVDQWLEDHPEFKKSIKPLEEGEKQPTVFKRDLHEEEEHAALQAKGAQLDQNLDSFPVARKFRHFREVLIISEKSG